MNIILLSNSTLYGSDYFQWAAEYVKPLLQKFAVKKVLFVPYALHDHDKYTEKVNLAFKDLFDLEVYGIHTERDPVLAVSQCEAIFIGGGNTFRLLNTLYQLNLIEAIRKRVLSDGKLYIGASAGSNVATVNICTTNDMPIVFPPSFDALNLVPFNINPHYIDPQENSEHMGESREKRINEYHEIPDTPPVVGLREGSLLMVDNNSVVLKGLHSARLFVRGSEPKEFPPNSDLSCLIT